MGVCGPINFLALLIVFSGDILGVQASPDFDQISCDDGCPNGTLCHPTLYICVPEAPDLDRPNIWLGCERNASDCSYFGFEYDGSYYIDNLPTPDGMSCDGPTNVRCVSKVAPPLPRPSGVHELHVASYNVWERPFWITQDGQRERTCRIPRELTTKWPQLDVVTFQETFMGGCWQNQASLRDLMTQHGFPYHTKIVDCVNFVNGGIWIASRWPILEDDQFVFESIITDTWDFFACKGVSYAKIKKAVDGESRVYHVMATHMQAGGGSRGDVVRQMEVAEWAAFVQAKNLSKSEAVIYTGDFNVHSKTDPDILANVTNVLGAAVPPLLSDQPPATHSPLDIDIQAQNQIDYTMYSTKHLQPTFSTQRFLNPEGDPAFPVCWCSICPWIRDYVYPEEGPGCREVNYQVRLSDHRPMYGKFIF